MVIDFRFLRQFLTCLLDIVRIFERLFVWRLAAFVFSGRLPESKVIRTIRLSKVSWWNWIPGTLNSWKVICFYYLVMCILLNFFRFLPFRNSFLDDFYLIGYWFWSSNLTLVRCALQCRRLYIVWCFLRWKSRVERNW